MSVYKTIQPEKWTGDIAQKWMVNGKYFLTSIFKYYICDIKFFPFTQIFSQLVYMTSLQLCSI